MLLLRLVGQDDIDWKKKKNVGNFRGAERDEISWDGNNQSVVGCGWGLWTALKIHKPFRQGRSDKIKESRYRNIFRNKIYVLLGKYQVRSKVFELLKYICLYKDKPIKKIHLEFYNNKC